MKVLDFHKKDLLVEYVDANALVETIIEWSNYKIRKITSDGESWLELEFEETTLVYDGKWKDADEEPASVTII